jgi:hypothetical protein
MVTMAKRAAKSFFMSKLIGKFKVNLFYNKSQLTEKESLAGYVTEKESWRDISDKESQTG